MPIHKSWSTLTLSPKSQWTKPSTWYKFNNKIIPLLKLRINLSYFDFFIKIRSDLSRWCQISCQIHCKILNNLFYFNESCLLLILIQFEIIIVLFMGETESKVWTLFISSPSIQSFPICSICIDTELMHKGVSAFNTDSYHSNAFIQC